MPSSLYDLYLKSLNPSAWWKLADAVGSGTAVDSSGNGWTGTVVGGVTFGQPGPVPGNSSALFDGTTGYITTAYNPGGSTFTSVSWYRSSASGSTNIILDSGAAENNNGLGLWLTSSGNLKGAAKGSLTAPAISNDGLWHFGVYAFTSNTQNLYQDGVQVISASGPIAPITGDYGLRIGAYGGGLFDYFSGSAAEVAVFPYALSAAQIGQLYSLAGTPAKQFTTGTQRAYTLADFLMQVNSDSQQAVQPQLGEPVQVMAPLQENLMPSDSVALSVLAPGTTWSTATYGEASCVA